MTTWYHGTVRKRFRAGEVVRPATEAGWFSNPLMVPGYSTERPLSSGRTVHMHDVVWVCADIEEAAGWADHSILKALPSEIRAMPTGGIAVYEVEPVGLDLPADDLHSATEAACDRAKVVREVYYEAFALDLCDECGDDATVGLGTDDQLCDECSRARTRARD